MRDALELFGYQSANALRRGIGGLVLGVFFLQFAKLVKEGVILRIAENGRIQHVIAIAVEEDFPP